MIPRLTPIVPTRKMSGGKMKYLVVWNEAEAEANNILRRAMQQVKYPWAWRKLNSARFHIIERHTVRVEDGFQPLPTFQQAVKP